MVDCQIQILCVHMMKSLDPKVCISIIRQCLTDNQSSDTNLSLSLMGVGSTKLMGGGGSSGPRQLYKTSGPPYGPLH